MTRSIGILIRLKNERDRAPKVLANAAQLEWEGRVVVHVAVDAASRDGTFEVVKEVAGALARGNLVYHILRHEAVPLSVATRILLEKSEEDALYLLDADNRMPAGRLLYHESLAEEDAPGVSAVKVAVVDLASGERKGTFPPDGRTIDFPSLRRANALDGLNLRLDGKYARDRLLPLLRKAQREIVEDYLFVLVAARDGRLTYHPVELGEYGLRPGRLSERRDPRPPTWATLELFERFVGSP